MPCRCLSRWALALIAIVLAVIAAGAQTTGSLTGTVKDPAGAVVGGAQVTIRNVTSGESRNVASDEVGRFSVENLAPGRYAISVSRQGFKVAEREVEVSGGRPTTVEIKLEIEAPHVEIGVSGKSTVVPNSEPTYRSLRDANSLETYSVSNLTIKRDVGTLLLKTGKISFVAPVAGRVVKAAFVGDGEFTLKPAIGVERDYIHLVTDKDDVADTFEKVVFCFTDDTYEEIKKQGQAAEAEPRAADLIRDFNKRLRNRPERMRSLVEALSASQNLEAEILADVYNPKRQGFFMAYISGKPFGDLRFIVRPHGALTQFLSPEEVGLLNFDPNGERDAVLYLAHLMGEYQSGKASSEEDKRIIDAEHYRIETVIDGEKLTATAELTYTALEDGDRVLSFGLLPALRVTRVTTGDREVNYIQEARKEDGDFYVVLPEALVKGKQYKISIEYQGNKVIEDAGGGNFAVGARTSWYPSVNVFNDRATFDLTFKVPRQYTLVGVGKEVKNWREGNFAASQWVSEVPLAVAGFNYGVFKKKEMVDDATKYGIEGYATTELPYYMKEAGDEIGAMTPSRLTDNAMVQAQNSMRIFTRWFGAAPYGRIAITQQPQFNFGQSWPTLVYLPIVAFFDSTQRYMLMGRISSGLTEFIQEVTPHEVSHQWWGHIVGWASYHDQWLSEGFADFSAGLYLQAVEKPDKYLTYWQHAREAILNKNEFGHRPNDAGPIWMGLRLNTYKTGGAYRRMVYPKGGYILHMLRSMMWDSKTGDQKFIDMMHEFVKTYTNRNASTESFKAIVDKHITPAMDLEGNHRMDWFFDEWVYGKEIPRYRFQYTLAPEADGKVMLKASLTQSEVSDQFKMLVPVYLDFDGKLVRLGTVPIQGNTSKDFEVRLPQKPKRVLINAFYDVLASELGN